MTGIYGVQEINRYIGQMFAQDFLLRRIRVRGEVSNCKYHGTGHIYFSLKEEGSLLTCVMFASNRSKGLSFAMSDGMQVVVDGAIGVYERDGKYQLYAARIEQSGQGELYRRFLAQKQYLEEMGMFDAAYKKPVPAYCRKVGIVTALTGAAVHDIETTARRRNPYIELVLYPAQVQGERAAASIVHGIETLDRLGLDCIIVGRGGGSMEDLWAFNEEIVARAVFEAATPIISAVGHETDFTIIDFVADKRAATPTAAAELAVFRYDDMLAVLGGYRERLQSCADLRLAAARSRIGAYKLRLLRQSPQTHLGELRAHLEQNRQQLAGMTGRRLTEKAGRLESNRQRLVYAARQRMTQTRGRLLQSAARLDGLSPLKQLQRGYGYLVRQDGKDTAAYGGTRAVSSIGQVNVGERIGIYVSDGYMEAEIMGKEALSYETDTGSNV